MFIFKSKKELQKHLSAFGNKKTIGFVPTMGALHQGHLHLIEQSNLKCDISICSIFVNPTQFNNPNDLANYPNTLTIDLEKLEKVKCDIVYNPPVNDLYTQGETAKSYDFGSLATAMEGEFRPGHFNGMATVIEKLLNIINPTIAFFGQKDLQQLYIVKDLVKQMESATIIEGVQTVEKKRVPLDATCPYKYLKDGLQAKNDQSRELRGDNLLVYTPTVATYMFN